MKKEFYRYCIQADVKEGLIYLENIPEDKKNDELRELEADIKERFCSDKSEEDIDVEDDFLRDIIRCYRKYYREALMREFDKDECKERLEDNLISVIRGNSIPIDDNSEIDEIESIIKGEFEKRDYYYLGGVTPPLLGPYIWKTQTKKVYKVDVPSGTQEVTVYFLKDFVERSWFYYATLGEKGTGGWAKEDALYCIYDAFKELIDKPQFKISYLVHEAQHFADYQEFPELESNGLEYRAKLAEMIRSAGYEGYVYSLSSTGYRGLLIILMFPMYMLIT